MEPISVKVTGKFGKDRYGESGATIRFEFPTKVPTVPTGQYHETAIVYEAEHLLVLAPWHVSSDHESGRMVLSRSLTGRDDMEPFEGYLALASDLADHVAETLAHVAEARELAVRFAEKHSLMAFFQTPGQVNFSRKKGGRGRVPVMYDALAHTDPAAVVQALEDLDKSYEKEEQQRLADRLSRDKIEHQSAGREGKETRNRNIALNALRKQAEEWQAKHAP